MISRFEAAIRGSGTGPSLDQPSPIDPFQLMLLLKDLRKAIC